MLFPQNSIDGTSQDTWQQCLKLIESKVGPHNFETWFRATELSFDDNGAPSINVPNQFFADFMEEHFGTIIAEVLQHFKINPTKLSFVSTPESDWSLGKSDDHYEEEEQTPEIAKQSVNPKADSQPSKRQNIDYNFHPDYTFDKFVIGDNNRFAYTPCLAVAEAPGRTSFNPLVIYGGTGLGKTHLLQAIGHFAYGENTAEEVMYITSHDFINQYMETVRSGKDSSSFYKKFTNAELLLIDDIQFFSGKPSTQKEFYRIFNHLLLQNKQIVLTSDRSPEKIPDMMEHIINRFMGGLMTDVQPPDFETRIAILKKKAAIDGFNLPDEVSQYIAGTITTNVRELEGALIKLIASASYTKKSITMEAVQEVFGDMVSRKTQKLTVELIQNIVADFFSITAHQLRAHTRKREIAHPRNIAMYLSKKWTKQSLRTIGLDFGGRDYSTVIYACKKIESTILENTELKEHIKILETTLKTGTQE